MIARVYVLSCMVTLAGLSMAGAQETRTWTGSWDGTPQEGDHIVIASGGDLDWDASLPHTVGSWTQEAAYTGTNTFETVFGSSGFTNFTITGDAVLNGGVWTHVENPSGDTPVNRLRVHVGGNLTIGAGGAISVDLKGFGPNNGPGKQSSGGHRGAAHGGLGGVNQAQNVEVAGTCYGSVYEPVELGSGAQSRGGGAVYLTVDGAAVIDGTIRANSHEEVNNWGGAGGSIFLRAASLSGSGAASIRADGGGGFSGHSRSGGGGGRVAVILTGTGADFDTFEGSIRAFGGPSVGSHGDRGQAGTVYLETEAQGAGAGVLILDNGDNDDIDDLGHTPMLADVVLSAFSSIILTNNARMGIVSGGAALDFSSTTIQGSGPDTAWISLFDTDNVTFGADFMLNGYRLIANLDHVLDANWTIGSSGMLSHFRNGAAIDYRLTLTLNGNLTIDAGGSIDVTGHGYAFRQGPGPALKQHYGAGHGGRGGTQDTDQPPAATHGRFLTPYDAGSGGWDPNGSGGGVVLLTVTGTTHVAGSIIANGNYPASGAIASGGGGSIALSTGYLTGPGAGMIQANGGYADTRSAGGGGRVAVYLTSPAADFSAYAGTIRAAGGGASNAARYGAAGSVYRQSGGEPAGQGVVTIDNNGLAVTRPDVVTELHPGNEAGWDEDLSGTTFHVRNEAELRLTDDAVLDALILDADGTLDLAGFTLTVKTLTVDGVLQPDGEYDADDFDEVIDSGDPADGKIIAASVPPGSLFLLR